MCIDKARYVKKSSKTEVQRVTIGVVINICIDHTYIYMLICIGYL